MANRQLLLFDLLFQLAGHAAGFALGAVCLGIIRLETLRNGAHIQPPLQFR
jgi:hypothetical protein